MGGLTSSSLTETNCRYTKKERRHRRGQVEKPAEHRGRVGRDEPDLHDEHLPEPDATGDAAGGRQRGAGEAAASLRSCDRVIVVVIHSGRDADKVSGGGVRQSVHRRGETKDLDGHGDKLVGHGNRYATLQWNEGWLCREAKECCKLAKSNQT